MLWVSPVAMQPDYKGPEVALVERIMQLQTLGVRCLECGNACLVPPQFMHSAKMLKVEDLLLSCVSVCMCFLICRQMCSRHLHQMIIPPFGKPSMVGS